MGLQGNSPDMNLSFVLAEQTPEGVPLEEPGVHNVSWSTSTIDPNVFMDAEHPNAQAVDLVWDVNTYINVFIYYFNENNKDVTGNFVPALFRQFQSVPGPQRRRYLSHRDTGLCPLRIHQPDLSLQPLLGDHI